MIRYSTIPDKIPAADAEMVVNPERERHGVRRFRAGMRNKKGKKDKNLNKHLLYHIMDESELTWENAIKVVSRYEIAHDSSSSSSSSSSSEDEVEAIEVMPNVKCDSVSSLAIQVRKNQKEIQKLKSDQEKLIAEFAKLSSSVETLNQLVHGISQQFAQS